MFAGSVVEIPLAADGVTGSRNPVTALPSQVLEASYVSLESGFLAKEGGQSARTPTPLAAGILSGVDWWPTATVQRTIVFLGNGAVLKDSGTWTFPVTLATGLSTTHPSQFVEGGAEATAQAHKLFLFTGASPVQVLAGDAATMTALALPAADWTGTNQPLTGALHADRLWAAGNSNDPHRVYYSTVTNHEDFASATEAGSVAIFPGEGDRITGMFSYRGVLLVGKAPRGLYTIDTTGVTPTTFKVDRLSRAVGFASGNAITQVDNDILFLDPDMNVQAASAVQALGDLSTLTYGQEVDLSSFLTQRVNAAAAEWARMAYYGYKRELHIAMAETGQPGNTARLVVDFNGATRQRFRFSAPESCPALWLMRTPDGPGPMHLMRGETSGQVWALDQATPSAAGVPGSSARVLTPQLDCGWVDASLAGKVKQGFYLELVTALLGPWNLDIDVYWDGRLHQHLAFTMRNQQGLPEGQVVSLQQRLLGSGRRVQFDVKQTVGGQPMAVYRLYMAFSALDTRQNEVYWR